MAEILKKREQNYQHVGKCIAEHRMRFSCIAGSFEHPIVDVQHRSVWLGLYIKMTCDMWRCIFQHVGISALDVGISQPFIILFSIELQHCDGYFISYHVICESKLLVKHF